MPEGPEVLRVGRVLQKYEGQKIYHAEVVSGRYMRTAISDLTRLQGAMIKSVQVKGKLIVFHLSKDGDEFAALSTLGMSGWWFGEKLKVQKYLRILLELDTDDAIGNVEHSFLSFCDPRNFGTFKVVSAAMARVKLAELGADIMVDDFIEFQKRVTRFGKNQTLAEGLLDQRIAAGCGNYIRAESMYRAKLSPHRPMPSLVPNELMTLWQAMQKIGLDSFESQTTDIDDEDLDAFNLVCYGHQTSPNGNPIESYADKHGRTVWYCPKEQS